MKWPLAFVAAFVPTPAFRPGLPEVLHLVGAFPHRSTPMGGSFHLPPLLAGGGVKAKQPTMKRKCRANHQARDFDQHYGFAPGNAAACSARILRNSRIAAGLSCTLCQEGIASSESAPSRCALL